MEDIIITYEDFKNIAKQYLAAALGKDYDVQEWSGTTNNDTTLDSLIVRKCGSDDSKMVCLDGIYQLAKDGEHSVAEALSRLTQEFYNRVPFTRESTEWIEDFAQVRDKICCRLVNTAANLELLKSVPSVPYLDLSIIFAVDIRLLGEHPVIPYSLRVSNQLMKRWGISLNELFRIAIANTQHAFPGTLQPMDDILTEAIDECVQSQGLQETSKAEVEEELIPCPMYSLSCQGETYGAIAVIYPDILETLADQVGGDLILFPSSIHEWLVMADDIQYDLNFLNAMVDEINQTAIRTEDRLSNHVYLFSHKERSLKIPTKKDAARR